MRSEFTLAAILTEKGLHSIPGGDFASLLRDDDDDIEPRWILDTTGRTFSLSDNNIGASYNPWLIFDDKVLAEGYERKLEITYTRDPDDYDYDYYED